MPSMSPKIDFPGLDEVSTNKRHSARIILRSLSIYGRSRTVSGSQSQPELSRTSGTSGGNGFKNKPYFTTATGAEKAPEVNF